MRKRIGTGLAIALASTLSPSCREKLGSSPAPLLYSETPLTRSEPVPPSVPEDKSKLVASVKPYALPLKPEEIINLERDIKAKQLLADPDRVLHDLVQHGMATGVPSADYQLFHQAYQGLAGAQVPVMVTSDSILHLYHLYFGEILKAIETQSLAPMVQALLRGLESELREDSKHAGPTLQEPFRNELAFLSVGIRLLDPKFEPHRDVKALVEVDLAKIEAHAGPDLSHALSSSECIRTTTGRCYQEDYSQYVPRGHYTQSEALKRYFKAMMWLGRIGHRVKYPDEVLQGVLLARAFKTAQCEVAGKKLPAPQVLARLDRILRFFIGASDDLNVFDVDPVYRKELGGGRDIHTAAASMAALQAGLRALRAPRILSNAVEATASDATDTTKQETQSVRLLGQRFAPDSELLGRMVYGHVGPDPNHPRYAEVVDALKKARAPGAPPPCGLTEEQFGSLDKLSCSASERKTWSCICEQAKVLDEACKEKNDCRTKYLEPKNEAYSQVCRLMPSALDVATVLGSSKAAELTRPGERYCGYGQEREQMTTAWATRLAAPPETLYLSWLGMLRPLLAPAAEGYPTWMRGDPYARKSLRTAIASWAELRHDTILYVKQSYTMSVAAPTAVAPELQAAKFYGTVEPLPDLLVAIRRLTRQTRVFLSALEVLPKEVESSLGSAEQLFDKLTTIAGLELTEKPLAAEQVDLINGIGDTFDALIMDLTKAITPPAQEKPPQGAVPAGESLAGKDDAYKTTLVADVHTDLNTKRVLEEGVGSIEWLLAVNRGADGALSVSMGPVFSYYEFTHDLADRLTNEKWRTMLAQRAVPPPAWWTTGQPLANGLELFCTRQTPTCDVPAPAASASAVPTSSAPAAAPTPSAGLQPRRLHPPAKPAGPR